MIDLTKEQIERKTLSEDCWIDVGDFEIRVDYPTYSQTTELRRLSIIWDAGRADENTEHFLAYYLRCAMKDVRGLVSGGKQLKLVVERGLAKELVGGEKPLDVVATFVHLGVLELAVVRIRERLEFSEQDKKKPSSQPNSSKKEESESPSDSTPVLKFETPKIPSIKMDEKSLSEQRA